MVPLSVPPSTPLSDFTVLLSAAEGSDAGILILI